MHGIGNADALKGWWKVEPVPCEVKIPAALAGRPSYLRATLPQAMTPRSTSTPISAAAATRHDADLRNSW
jgi:uncharacterized membrane protein